MSLTVHLALGYEFEVRARATDVFDVLADVPLSVSHFPKVERLTDLGDGVYRWDMARVGTEQVHLQTVYASRYVSDRAKGTVTWTPVPGVGNAQVGGRWKIRGKKASTAIRLDIEADIRVDLPAVMRLIVEPVVGAEFESLVERYIDNLIERFGGEVA